MRAGRWVVKSVCLFDYRAYHGYIKGIILLYDHVGSPVKSISTDTDTPRTLLLVLVMIQTNPPKMDPQN